MTESGDSVSSNDGDDSIAMSDDDDIISCNPLSPLEWRLLKMFLIGVVPLSLIPLPLFLFYFSFHLYCEQLNSSSSTGLQQQSEQCSDITWLLPYLYFLLVSLHSLINPITSLWLNKDFQRPSPIRRQRMRMMSYL